MKTVTYKSTNGKLVTANLICTTEFPRSSVVVENQFGQPLRVDLEDVIRIR